MLFTATKGMKAEQCRFSSSLQRAAMPAEPKGLSTEAAYASCHEQPEKRARGTLKHRTEKICSSPATCNVSWNGP